MYNVNNNCSTGSTALYLAANLIRGGLNDCVLAVGFEKMNLGSLGATFMDREQPTGRHFATLFDIYAPESGAARGTDVRHGRTRAHGEVRLAARALRVDRLQEPQALGEQPVLAVPGRLHARRDQAGEDDLRAARADASAALPDLRRVRCRGARLRALRRRARPLDPGRRDRRAVDGDRHGLLLRGQERDQRSWGEDDRAGRPRGLRAGADGRRRG
nr:hypothetical protein [Conexibacter sp. W3-3-2]